MTYLEKAHAALEKYRERVRDARSDWQAADLVAVLAECHAAKLRERANRLRADYERLQGSEQEEVHA